MRKIALLRAVGAQKSQICSMLFWEAVYLLCIGLPFGLLLGLLSAYGVVTYINRFHGMELIFAIHPTLLLGGLVCGCLSIFLGRAYPMIVAVRIPLAGLMTKGMQLTIKQKI
ncbi:MAG: FtsX-like permease family protein [Lachnospiraceae bacterium]